MATTALAQEKVWFDKPSYDKAERLYFERMAKVVTCKIMENCTFNAGGFTSNNCQDLAITNNPLKSKSEKCKGDNKPLDLDSGLNEVVKQSKYQLKNNKRNKKEDDTNLQKTQSLDETEKHDSVEEKKKDVNVANETGKKCNAKEAKEKKNKADTRHRNKKGKNDMKERKEQLPEQGNQQSTTTTTCPILPTGGSLANEVAKARQHIKQSLQCMDDIATLAGVPNQDVVSRIALIEKENQDLRNIVQGLKGIVIKLEERIKVLEVGSNFAKIAICPAKPAPPKSEPEKKDSNDDDVDLFGSDSEGEDAEAAKIREERLAAYAAKKSKKPALIAKSNIILDVKPWDDETDMKIMEEEVRKIEMDGLIWGAAKLVPLAFGIHKLQISCVVEDDKVSVDYLIEQIEKLEDYVQSVDIAAFNKV